MDPADIDRAVERIWRMDHDGMTSNPASDAARLLALKRKTGQGVCLVCGAAMVGLLARRYCSVACKNHAKYRRRVARQQAAVS